VGSKLAMLEGKPMTRTVSWLAVVRCPSASGGRGDQGCNVLCIRQSVLGLGLPDNDELLGWRGRFATRPTVMRE